MNIKYTKLVVFSFAFILCTLYPFSNHDVDAFNAQDTQNYANTSSLQDLIDAAKQGDTITLPAGTYREDITLNKNITLEGNGSANTIIDGKVTLDNGSQLRNVTVNDAIMGSMGISIDAILAKKGIILHDDGTNASVSIKNSTIQYNDDQRSIGILVNGNDTGSVRNNLYEIKENTFINQQASNAPVISWPFTTLKNDELNASQNYWYNGTSEALFDDIKVEGNVRYYTETYYQRSYQNHSYQYALFAPGENTRWKKSDTNPELYKDYFQMQNVLPNTNVDHDTLLSLYKRSFQSSGISLDLSKAYLYQVYDSSTNSIKKLPHMYEMKYESMEFYMDDNFRVPYKKENYIISDNSYAYMRWINPYLKFYVEPRKLIAYEGGTSIEQGYPLPTYDFYAPNINYDETDPSTGSQYFIFENRIHSFVANNQTITGSALSAFIDSKNAYYSPWYPSSSSDIIIDPTLDPDGDLMPFTNAYTLKQQYENSSTYTLSIGNKDDITKFQLEPSFNKDNWIFPNLQTGNWSLEFQGFYPEYKDTELTMRKISNDTTLSSIVHKKNMDAKTPMGIIEDSAIYTDSANKSLSGDKISLFNDNKEPDTTAYEAMMSKVKQSNETKNASYAYHHLALVNYTDGNNVVTTDKDVTLFMPYPVNYDQRKPLKVAWFKDYHRMPNDSIETSQMEWIKNIKYEANGISFSVDSSELGSFVIAYNMDSTTTPDTSDKWNPSDKPNIEEGNQQTDKSNTTNRKNTNITTNTGDVSNDKTWIILCISSLVIGCLILIRKKGYDIKHR